MKNLNAYVESFGTTFANGRPGRPGTYPVNCNWPVSCRKGCGFNNTVQQGVYSTGCGNSVLSVSVSSCGCGRNTCGSGCNSRCCRPLPPCPGCFDGCTQIYCDDKGCKVTGYSSFSMNQCHCFDPCCPPRCGRPTFDPCCRPLPPCPPPCPPVCRPLPPCRPICRPSCHPICPPVCPPVCRPVRPCQPVCFDDCCRPPFRPPFRPFPGPRPGPMPGPRPFGESDEYWESYEYGEAEA